MGVGIYHSVYCKCKLCYMIKKAYFYINLQKFRLVKLSNPATFTRVLPYFKSFQYNTEFKR